MLKNRTKFRFRLQSHQLQYRGVHSSHLPKVIRIHKNLVPRLRSVAILLVILRLDGRLAIGDAPKMPGEHNADRKAEDDGEDVYHGEHHLWRVIRPVECVVVDSQRL